MARKAPVCVLFRRGPSRWTQLVKWHTDTDVFEAGNWFKGRIYEHRCDVSPNGRFLLYFACKINPRTVRDPSGYTYAWTAISEPPRYTALMLWPKGDCWHGGGLFTTDRDVWLNHRPAAAKPHPSHVCSLFRVTPNPRAVGEDSPVHEMRLVRDGWKRVAQGTFQPVGKRFEVQYEANPPEIWERPGRTGMRLRRELHGINFKAFGGPYVEHYVLVLRNGTTTPVPGATWADLDQKGKLVFARAGRLFRGWAVKGGLEEKELLDLNPNRPPARAVPAPAKL
jgi:hypothetical protein